MTYTSTVTQKGQITLPKSARDQLNIQIRQKVTLEVRDGHIRVTPTSDILDLAGSYKGKRRKNVLKARESFEKEYQRV